MTRKRFDLCLSVPRADCIIEASDWHDWIDLCLSVPRADCILRGGRQWSLSSSLPQRTTRGLHRLGRRDLHPVSIFASAYHARIASFNGLLSEKLVIFASAYHARIASFLPRRGCATRWTALPQRTTRGLHPDIGLGLGLGLELCLSVPRADCIFRRKVNLVRHNALPQRTTRGLHPRGGAARKGGPLFASAYHARIASVHLPRRRSAA